MKPNMIKKWSIALLVAAGAAGLTGCEGMRVDEGASESDHSGIVADRAITGQLSGVVVDEHGRALEGATISAYGLSTTSKANGTWTLSNVPITNLVISNVYDNGSSTTLPTDQDADVNSPMVAKGKIYTTFSMKDHATFHSTYEGAIAVITHSGDESGANSIVVSEISATIPYVELSKMDRTFVGNVYDLGESNFAFQKSAPSSVQLRLLPNYVDDNLYGFDGTDNNTQNLGGNEVESAEFSPGYYGVDPVTVALDNGSFTIGGAGALRSGYELRVDGTSYRPAQYPEWNTGLQQTLIYVYDANNRPLVDVQNQLPNNGISPGAIAAGGGDNISEGAYWKIEKLNIATGTNNLVTDFGNLYVENFEAQDNADPTVALFSYYGGPDNLDTSGNQTYENDNITIDSDVATALGTTQPLVVVFNQDMRSIDGNIITTAPNAVRLYDDKLTLIDISSATMDGRTLTITTTAAMSTGFYRLVLKRDRFVDKNGERLTASNPFGTGNEISAGDEDYFDSIYGIKYGTSAYSLASVTDLDQNADDSLAKTTAPRIFIEAGTSSATEEIRLDQLREAIKHVIVDDTSTGVNDNLSFTEFADDDNVTFSQASVSFIAGKGNYKFTVTNGAGVAISSSTTVTGTGTISLATGVQSGGFTDSEATFNVASKGTVTVTIDNASIGYTVGVTPLGELATTDTGMTVTRTLVDRTYPRVALQFSSENGQDNGTVALFNYASTDETGETVYSGSTQILYPKLNLTASLYDHSGLRARTEIAGDNNITGDTATTDDLLTSSLGTPLLATTSATITTAGTTASGSSNQRYTPADYTSWAQTGSAGTSGPPCEYYYQEAVGITGWVPVDVAAGVATVDSGRTSIGDASVGADPPSATDWNDNAALATYVSGGTATFGGVTVNLIKSATNCDTSTASTLASLTQRKLVVEMTEDVASFTYDSTFQATTGATLEDTDGLKARTNVVTGSDLAGEIDNLTNAASGESHVLLTLGDWRNADESPRWDNENQIDVANTVAEGLSTNSLLQMVGIADLNGNAASTADHAVGVLIADATPAIATNAVGTETAITVSFDQPLNSGISAQDNVTRDNVTFGSTSCVGLAGVGPNDAGTAYHNAFGVARTATLEAAVSGSTLTVNLVNDDDLGFVPELNGATVEFCYPQLQDNNNNSWDLLDGTYDQYDDAGDSTPILVSSDVDNTGPKIDFRLDNTTAGRPDNASIFLYQVSAPATLSSAHVTINTDNDTTYTPSTDIDASALTGFLTFTNGGLTEDIRLVDIWNSFDPGTAARTERIPDNNSDYNRVVLSWQASTGTNVTGLSVSPGAQVYYYRPTVDNVTNNNIYGTTNNSVNGAVVTIIDTMATQNDNGSIAVDSVDNNTLVFRFPGAEFENNGTALDTDEDVSSHRLILDNVSINGIPYVISIAAPTEASAIDNAGVDAASSTATGSLPAVTYFRKVFLETTDNVTGLLTNETYVNETSLDRQIQFMEPIASATLSNESDGVNYADTAVDGVADQTTTAGIVDFTYSATAATDTVTINAQTNYGETNTDTLRIGHGAELTLTVTDAASNSSTVKITRNRAHGVNLNGYPVITNTISGSALE